MKVDNVSKHEINFYTIGCPSCDVLKSLMDSKGLIYNTVTDNDVMSRKGFTNVPMLEVDGKVMDYLTSYNYVGALNVVDVKKLNNELSKDNN